MRKFVKGSFPLQLASVYGHLRIVKLLLDKGADANQSRHDGVTALYCASEKDQKDVVWLLLKRGADVNKATADYFTPLNKAASASHHKVCRMLLNKGADPNLVAKDGWGALHWSIKFGRIHTVKNLLAKGADVNQARTTDNVTPLLLAAEGGHDKIAKMLVAKGANINARRTDGTTPLAAALHQGHQQIVKLLLKNGAEFITTVGSCGGGSRGDGVCANGQCCSQVSLLYLNPKGVPRSSFLHSHLFILLHCSMDGVEIHLLTVDKHNIV